MKKSAFSVSFLVMVALLVSACSPSGVNIDLPFLKINPSSNEQPQATPASIPQAEQPVNPPVVVPGEGLAAVQGALTQIYEAVNPSVVAIQVSVPVQGLNNFQFNIPGFDNSQQPPTQNGLGTGFIWDKSGHIVTNNHVIEGANDIMVRFSDGFTADATLVGSDPDSDLAVIKVDVSADRLFPVSLADSDQVKVGQLAIAIGTPYGLESTMTVGIISALGRSLPVENSATTSGLTYSIPDVIQTDAPINPGNSGGVLLNDQGQVVGVTAAIESSTRSNAGIGFVIPVNIVKRVVPALIVDGSYEHAWLGISGASLTSALAEAMDLPEETLGALVLDVTSGSPADEAGLRGGDRTLNLNGREVQVGGDVITAVDGQTINGMDDLVSYLATDSAVGQRISLQILREGKQQTLEAVLASRPSSTNLETARVVGPNRGASLGITGASMISELASAMDLPRNTHGVLIVQVLSGSAADDAGLRGGSQTAVINGEQVRIGGDVITAVENQSVSTVAELRAVLANFEPGESVDLTVIRDGETVHIEVTLGALQ